MSRGITRTFCLRSTLPPTPELEGAELECKHYSINPLVQPENEQKDDSAQSPKRKPTTGRTEWKPFDAEAFESAQTATAQANNSWAAQQAEFWTQIEQPRHSSRGKAAASASLAPPASAPSSAPAPANPFLPKTSHSNNAHELPKQTPKKTSRKNWKKSKDSSMAAPPKGKEYVPPHLRNHNSANGSPAASQKSKQSMTTKLHSSPNDANQHGGAPPSPPTTPQEPEQCRKHASATPKEVVYDGWQARKPSPPAVTKNLGNPRWPRGPQPYKKTVWPKARDMKYKPSSSDDGGGVTYKSNSNGDPDYDVKKLLDWNGDWLPAPESWCARKSHADRHFGDHIEQWMNKQAPECIKPVYYLQHTFNGHAKTTKVGDEEHIEYILEEGQLCKELVPHYWSNAMAENEHMSELSKLLPKSDSKPVVDSEPVAEDERMVEDDINDDLPWWERYEDVFYIDAEEDGQNEAHLKYASPYINALEVPEAKTNLADPIYPAEEWQLASTEDKVQHKIRRAEAKQRKLLARRNRHIPESNHPVTPMEDRRLRPKTNMYIRPVQPADVRGIADIYNWYVDNSIHAIEFDKRTEAQMGQRISDITTAGLPYLVAIDRGNRSRLTNQYVNERIVGYIKLEDYCGQSTLFRYTFEMELFVHPGFLNKGIGKCLMDRILEMADTSYRPRGGYQYINEYEYLKAGPSRVIKTILLNVHHENSDEMENAWQSNFLNAFKFSRSGRLRKAGYKLDKVVDVSIYAHHTKEDIDANGRPTVAG